MNASLITVRAATALVCAGLVLSPVPSAGQQPGTPPRSGPAPQLKIFVLTGQGAVHRLALGLTTDIVIEVRSLDDIPVEGATVVFTLPQSGAGGTFRGQREFTARTNGSGQAVAVGFEPNGVEGRFQVLVKAVEGARTGQVAVDQANSLRAIPTTFEQGRRFPKRLVIIGAAAGAATAGLLLALGGSSSPSTVSLNPGAVVIGPVR